MWVVMRSDARQSIWASGHDAKHYIATLGTVKHLGHRTYAVTLPDQQTITATMVRP
jgi:hypothetical protein